MFQTKKSKFGDPKVFTANNMSITLGDEFVKQENPKGRQLCCAAGNAVVFAMQEKFSGLSGGETATLDEYGKAVIESNDMTGRAELQHKNGLTYFVYDYTNADTKQVFSYFSYVYRADDSFWLVQFAVLKDDAERLAPQIETWAKSVKFVKAA